MRQLSHAAGGALFAPETGAVFLTLIDIAHPSLPEPLRFVNNWEDILLSDGERYRASAFVFTPPADTDGKMSPARVQIDNIDRQIVATIRSIPSTSPLEITARIVLADSPDRAELGPLRAYLRNVTYTAEMVSGDLYPVTSGDTALPAHHYTPRTFPGLHS